MIDFENKFNVKEEKNGTCAIRPENIRLSIVVFFRILATANRPHMFMHTLMHTLIHTTRDMCSD